jgi:hypothetical protein
MRGLALAGVLGVSACSFPVPADVDDDGSDGAVAPDAMIDATPCTASSIVCDDASGTYTECSAEGTVEYTLNCPLGCDATEERCVDIDPSNALAAYLDRARNDPTVPEVEIVGVGVLDTLSGELMDGSAEIEVPDERVGNVQVFMFKKLTITGSLKVSGIAGGSRAAPVLVVDGDVVINGPIDVSGDLDVSGPGARLVSDACTGGYVLGGGTPSAGAGGGGRQSAGASGGAAGNGESAGTAGPQYVDDDLSPLAGGCRGGFVLEDSGGNTYTSAGGGGGGAIQIVSSTRIIFSEAGSIDASGGGGTTATIPSGTIGGGGGGSGGGILLEAPVITLDGPSVVLSTKGGSGSAAGNGGNGQGNDGGLSGTRAAGGTNTGQAYGGDGALFLGAGPYAGGTGSTSTADGGGGGGGSGQVRLNSLEGAAEIIHGASIRSQRTEGRINTRLVPVSAQ